MKTRLVNIQQEGINFVGFSLTWRKSRAGRGYLHVEPGQKSRHNLRERLREILNHRTEWRATTEVGEETNRVLRGWAAYFHYRNGTSVLHKLRKYSQDRLRRWLWRKHKCQRGLWQHYTDERLHEQYGLYPLPIHAAWKANR